MTKKEEHFFQKFLVYWLPVLVWAGMVFYLSDQPGLKAGFSPPNEILARKIAHITEFGILGWLIWRIFHFSFKFSSLSSAVFSLLLAGAYAVSDEFHQAFVANRSGRIADTFLDFLGILLALLVVVQIYLHRIIKKFVIVFVLVFLIAVILINSMIEKAKEAVAENKKQIENLDKAINQEIVSIEEPENSKSSGAGDSVEKLENEQKTEDLESTKEVQESGLPQKIILEVPFSPQAPFGVWDEVHEEACEEASLIMVKYYLDEKKLTPQIAENEIQKLKEYQLEKFGHYHDSTMEELVKIAEDYYGIKNLEVIYDFDKEQLKKELAKNNPIIVPTAGRELGNPNFTQPGPLYHNLVLKGYEGETIITNDPGTRKGEGFKYSLNVIFSAIHDFSGEKERILEGRKAMIVIR